jgi:hypothetical protein
MTAKQINIEEIYNAHWQAFIDMVSDSTRKNAEQIPLFSMTKEEIAEFEAFVADSTTFEIIPNLQLR